MSTTQDTEITLGTGKLLLLFFGLVAVCAVFFAFGYNLGRSSATPALAERTTPAVDITKQANKSGAASATKTSDLTFYKAVAQNESNPQLTPAQTPAAAPNTPSDPPAAQPATTDNPDPMTLPSANSYYVQVAAVSKQEDADALVEALKKKQYPAFTASGSTSDKLFHVQIGPYGDVKDAEIMRTKLIGDGYNPILKK
ncbi:MAG TPA: SPOR domain-containing protein [Terriglobales bacterium]|nr:SPOR domain-containing protein [Terriglobales bacterium]